MVKRNLTLQQHLEHPKYGARFTLTLRYLADDYGWDTDEITLEEEVMLMIALSLEQYISPKLIAEQVDARLKQEEEEEIEPISAPTKSVGMFESDLWEHEIPRAPMHGPWTLPPAKGGFLHTPRIESPRSSPHYVPNWQKVRTYGQDYPEKTRQEIANDLGLSKSTVTSYLRGTIGLSKTDFAKANPDLPQIFVAENPRETASREAKKLIYGWGDRDEADEHTKVIQEEIINAFVERMTKEEERDQVEIVHELVKEYKIGAPVIIRLLGNLYDRELSEEGRKLKGSITKLEHAGTSFEEIEEYVRQFGDELTDTQIAKALGIAYSPIKRARKKLNIKFPKYNILGYRNPKKEQSD